MSVQLELVPTVANLLDQTGGVIRANLEDLNIDPERRTNIALLAGQIGFSLCGPGLPELSQSDRVLNVYRNDLFAAHPRQLGHGLYMPVGDPRRDQARQLATVGNEKCTLDLPGVIRKDDGVVVSEKEYITIARNARDLAKSVYATTSNANRDLYVVEERDETAGRSVNHAMESKKKALVSLEAELIEQREILRILHKDAAGGRRAYKAKNLDPKRRQADEIIHETARIAVINLGEGTTALNAIHRAIASNLYRKGTTKEMSIFWQWYTLFNGRYINAKLGKIDQSKKAVDKQAALHARYLPSAA